MQKRKDRQYSTLGRRVSPSWIYGNETKSNISLFAKLKISTQLFARALSYNFSIKPDPERRRDTIFRPRENKKVLKSIGDEVDHVAKPRQLRKCSSTSSLFVAGALLRRQNLTHLRIASRNRGGVPIRERRALSLSLSPLRREGWKMLLCSI